jgi:hypothetical protein
MSSRCSPKRLVASLVSLVLLYYGAVGAVLRCLHNDGHSDTAVTMSENGARAENSYLPFPIHAPASLECIGFDYHAEPLAASSSLSQLQRWDDRLIAQVTDFSIPDVIATGGARGLWLSAVFDKVSPLSFPIHSPRYLSLSVLRF